MRCGWKPCQVWPDLRQDDLNNSWPKAGDRIQTFDDLRVWLQATGYVCVDALDAGIQAVDEGELLLE